MRIIYSEIVQSFIRSGTISLVPPLLPSESNVTDFHLFAVTCFFFVAILLTFKYHGFSMYNLSTDRYFRFIVIFCFFLNARFQPNIVFLIQNNFSFHDLAWNLFIKYYKKTKKKNLYKSSFNQPNNLAKQNKQKTRTRWCETRKRNQKKKKQICLRRKWKKKPK